MSAVPHLRVMPGGRRPDAVVPGRSHVTNLRPKHPTTTRVVFLTDLEASVAVAYAWALDKLDARRSPGNAALDEYEVRP